MDHRHDPRRVFGSVLLGIGSRQHDAAEVRARRFAQIEFALLDRRVVAAFQIVGEAEREAVDRVEFGIDALRQLQSLDRRIRLPRPHQNIAAAGEAVGVARIDRDGAVKFRLRFLVAVMENVNTTENDMRAHVGVVETQAPCSPFPPRELRKSAGCSAQPIVTAV